MYQTAEGVRWDNSESHVYHDQDVFEVSEVASQILKFCSSPRSKADVVTFLLQEYDVAETEVTNDTETTLAEFLAFGLVKEVSDGDK